MTHGTVKKADVERVYVEAVRAVAGPQWSPPGWEGGEARAREEAKVAFGKRLAPFAAWLFKQSAPTSGQEALEVLRANVEKHTRAIFDSTLTKKKYGPDDCLEWLQANGLAPPKPARRTQPPPLDLTGPSRPKVTVVDLEHVAEQRRLAAEALRAMSEAIGRGPVGPRKAREPFALPELEGAAQ